MQLAIRRHLLASTVLIGTSMLGTAAYAQTQAAAAPADEGTIVVTGSLITNPNLERSTPVNVTTSEEVELRQTNVAEQLLREIPGVVPSIGSAVNNGNGGASYVNLRGLGSNRNIVLLDGNRIAPSGLVGRVDLNNIPLALIERTEVLTGGASTTYGADAVSGVVNFITKRNFSGLDVSASEQITERGDGNVFRIDTTIGANFDDGRGNAVLSLGYQEADPVYQGARKFSRTQYSSTSGKAAGSDVTVPAEFVLNGDLAQINPTTGNLDPVFQQFNFNPYNVFQTPFKRFNIFGQANYQVTDGIEVYTRALFSKNTVDTVIAPSGIFDEVLTIPVSNPFLPAGARAQFCGDPGNALRDASGAIIPLDADPDAKGNFQGRSAGAVAACIAAANQAPTIVVNGQTVANPAYRQIDIETLRRTPDVGPRISDYRTTIFDYRAGIRGSITDSINFDVSGAYGESENLQTIKNYVLLSRAKQALQAVDPNTCLDTSNGCVPLNIFGAAGTITPAAAAFLSQNSTTLNRTSLAQARATISGDFGAALPWASDAISFAVGGEYRRYTAEQQSDLLAKTPGELGGAGGAAPDIKGGYDVYEAFGELIAPIVQDKPFFHSLTFEGGARYSHYTVNAPGNPKFNTTTFKLGGSWEPVSDIKIRGNYSRAVRAPNISELFTPVSTGLTNLTDEPCTGTRPVGNATLTAICLAQGAPQASIGKIAKPNSGQANATGGGDLTLKPEKANSFTIGAVVQPSFLPGFSASVDYYNIRITHAITSPTPGDVLAGCFGPLDSKGNATAIPAGAENTVACQSIRRNPGTGQLSGSPATTFGLPIPTSNLGKLFTDGIDVTMNYNTDLGFAKLALSFAGNWTHSSKFQAIFNTTPTFPRQSLDRECVGFYSVNCASIQPEFSWSQRSTLTFDNVDLSLLWRHISAVRFEPISGTRFSGTLTGGDLNGQVVNFNSIPSFDYFDLATRIGVGDNLTLTLTVANLFDKQPPVLGNTIGSTTFNSGNTYPSSYDALGRTFRVGARLRF